MIRRPVADAESGLAIRREQPGIHKTLLPYQPAPSASNTGLGNTLTLRGKHWASWLATLTLRTISAKPCWRRERKPADLFRGDSCSKPADNAVSTAPTTIAQTFANSDGSGLRQWMRGNQVEANSGAVDEHLQAVIEGNAHPTGFWPGASSAREGLRLNGPPDAAAIRPFLTTAKDRTVGSMCNIIETLYLSSMFFRDRVGRWRRPLLSDRDRYSLQFC